MEKKNISSRKFLVLFTLIFMYLILVFYLFYLQIIKGKQFAFLADSNAFKIRYIYSPRGNILDRNGEIIVGNKRKFRLILMIKKKNTLNDILENIEEVLEIDSKDLQKRIQQNYFAVVKVFDNLEDLNKWKFNHKIEDNVFLEEFWVRDNYYECFNHITGYMQYTISNDKPIKGLEKIYNSALEGRIIQHNISMDTNRNVLTHKKNAIYKNGKNLVTTLLLRAQLYAEKLFGHFQGGVVIMNRKGEILVSFSSPNLKVYENIPSKNNCYFNKVFQGKYPPGSIFKTITSMTLMEIGFQSVVCNGFMQIGNRTFHCWKRSGHGLIDNIEKAFRYSCNVFFYSNCCQLGDFKEVFFRNLNELGFNKKTQNVFSEEISAPMKQPSNKIQMMMMSFGQGFANSTILQNCIMVVNLMTGKKIIPTFTDFSNEPLELNIDITILLKTQNLLRSTFSEGGGCERLWQANRKFFGKTGTAQVMSMTNGKSFSGYKKEHSIFVGGEEDSQLYVSILVENAGFGIDTAGTFAIKLLNFIINDEI
jgi:penicillin-binding protein 2